MINLKKNYTKEGEVTESLPNTMYRVKLDGGKFALTTLKGAVRRKRFVRIFPGDRVRVEFTPYDESRGRIVAKLNR